MLTAYNEQLEQVFAQHASKQEQYFCPICKAAVILKQGAPILPIKPNPI
ncbi:hypothetical protein PQ701_04595 [Staphylococcus coagulans]|nr:hypothetical protein [Staphylococcus coagulans]MDU9304497.1 hypothetical protein [Staphylococcus coagulans]